MGSFFQPQKKGRVFNRLKYAFFSIIMHEMSNLNHFYKKMREFLIEIGKNNSIFT